MPIRPLPPLLVNQIAAGEVIERPASVVKELLENAIDAGAERIHVEIEQGGKALVRVADDGDGIEPGELPLALAPHATSKIASAEDLDMIATMGFRGEALASIASVSRIAVRSRPRRGESAMLVEGEGGVLEDPRPAPGPAGTTVSVRSLFFNTPARRKFLKTDATESGRVREVIEAIALACPSIGFTLVADGRPRLDLPPHRSPALRVLAVLGEELEPELLEVDARHAGGPTIWGLAGTPALARATGRHQRVYVNARPVVDRTITHAIREAYRGLIDPTRAPTIALFIEMDPAAVDVNVHPAKAEVRFRAAGAVHAAVLDAVRAALRKADLTPALRVAETGGLQVPSAWPPGPRSPGSGIATSAPGTIVESFRRLDRREKGFVYAEMKAALARDAPEIIEREIAGAPAVAPVAPVRGALQIHASYIVTEDEAGMLIIDQHALHERVTFERLRERVEAGSLESQRLLLPAVIDVDTAQLEALAALDPILRRLGIEVEPIGPAACAVQAFSSLLLERNVDPATFMAELVARAVDEGHRAGSEAILHEILDMMACKAAIKAGDRLEPAEIEALLKARDEVDRSSNCPHGRPTTLRLSLHDLERQFGRR